MRKCEICHEHIKYTEIRHIIFKQYHCNNCRLLFKYKSKNVKIRCIKIKVLYLIQYEYLIRFADDDVKNALYQYLFNRYCKKKQKIIFFNRAELAEILKENYLKQKENIIFIEIL